MMPRVNRRYPRGGLKRTIVCRAILDYHPYHRVMSDNAFLVIGVMRQGLKIQVGISP
jgi:hypothetical protein